MPRTKSQLAKQVAVLGLVLCAVAFVLAVPLRSYLAQRAALGVELVREQQLRDQDASLAQEQAALQDPAYIESEAKRRLQYVKPGDTVYVVHAQPLPAVRTASPATTVPAVPWYSRLWDTLSDPVVTAAPVVPAGRAAPTAAPTAPAAARTAPIVPPAPASGTSTSPVATR